MTLRSSALCVSSALFLVAAPLALAQGQASAAAAPVGGAAAVTPGTVPDRAGSYYHAGLARLYEEQAVNTGRSDYAAQAVEEYKLALNSDPASTFLQDGLADLYFKLGRIREAVSTAQDLVKQNPNDLAAHLLLGRVYLRSLNDAQGPQAQEMLGLAIAEYERLAQLQPADLETHLILGQLYGLNHESAKAEAQFKLARGIDSNSQDAVLAIARLYAEQGETERAAQTLATIPEPDRSAQVDFALGAAYDHLHKPKEAAKAYQAALTEDPNNPDTERALAAALLADEQLAPAGVVLNQLVTADPTDLQSMVQLAEVERRQGHYQEALTTLGNAKSLNGSSDNLELSFNEAVLYDALGQYDKAVKALEAVLTATAKPVGSYSDGEKSNRAIFLDRLGIVYQEENDTADAVAAYKQMVELGGDYVLRGYDGEVEAYREGQDWKQATAAAAEAAQALPSNRDAQLLYASQLADTGDAAKALALAKAQLNGSKDDRLTEIAIATMDLRLNRSADAMTELGMAQALTTKPDEIAYIELNRAMIYDHDKNFDGAEAEYRKVLAIDPDNATVLNDLGFLLADKGVRLTEAQTMIERAVKLDPQNGAFLDSLGWVEYRLGNYDAAAENLKKALARTDSDPSIHAHLGEVYQKTGQLQMAVTQWEKSVMEYAHSLPADADPADVAKVKRKLEEARTQLAKNGGGPGKKS